MYNSDTDTDITDAMTHFVFYILYFIFYIFIYYWDNADVVLLLHILSGHICLMSIYHFIIGTWKFNKNMPRYSGTIKLDLRYHRRDDSGRAANIRRGLYQRITSFT